MEQELLNLFKSYIDVVDSEKDDLFLEILAYAEGFIYETYGVAIYNRSVQDVLVPAYGKYSLYTADGHIRTISSLLVDDKPLDPATDVSFKRNKITINNLFTPIYPTSKVIIDYSVGYENIDSIPKGLLNALLMLAKKIWTDASKDTDMYSSMSIDIKEGVRVIEDLPAVAKQALDSHKIFRL